MSGLRKLLLLSVLLMIAPAVYADGPCDPDNFSDYWDTCNESYIAKCGINGGTASVENCSGQVVDVGDFSYLSDGGQWQLAGFGIARACRTTDGPGIPSERYLSYRPPTCEDWTWHADADVDGYINASNAATGCNPGGGVVNWIRDGREQGIDCDDNNVSVTQETKWHLDNDGDQYWNDTETYEGFDNPTEIRCTPPDPGNWTANPEAPDCDDQDNTTTTNCNTWCQNNPNVNSCSELSEGNCDPAQGCSWDPNGDTYTTSGYCSDQAVDASECDSGDDQIDSTESSCRVHIGGASYKTVDYISERTCSAGGACTGRLDCETSECSSDSDCASGEQCINRMCFGGCDTCGANECCTWVNGGYQCVSDEPGNTCEIQVE